MLLQINECFPHFANPYRCLDYLVQPTLAFDSDHNYTATLVGKSRDVFSKFPLLMVFVEDLRRAFEIDLLAFVCPD